MNKAKIKEISKTVEEMQKHLKIMAAIVKEQEAKEKITYSIGDRFIGIEVNVKFVAYKKDEKFILIHRTGTRNEVGLYVGLVSLSDGYMTNNKRGFNFTAVKDKRKITEEEFEIITVKPDQFVRYWDNAKQITVDIKGGNNA